MDVYELALALGFTGAYIFAGNLPRARLWLVLGALSFTVSSLYWAAGLPNPAIVGGVCDLVVCLVLYLLAHQWWEMRVWNCYHVMIVLNASYHIDSMDRPGWLTMLSFHNLWGWTASLAGVSEKFAYGALLDAANWVALVLIGGAAIAQAMVMQNAVASTRGSGGWRNLLVRRVLATRKIPAFWRGP